MQKTQKEKWFEDADFWATFAPDMFTQEKLESTGEEIERLIGLLEIKEDAKILDLCCGIGRHSIEFARRGYSIVGVDITGQYLDMARKQAESENLDVEFIRSDMRQFCQIESFDVVINMFTAFGYFEDINDDRRVLANIYCSLRKGGKLIIETMSKEILARIFQERDWHETHGKIFLRQSKICRNWSWCENTWMVLEGNSLKKFQFGHRIYSAAELTILLKDCGFCSVNIYGDLDGSDYDHNAKRLIAVATKT